MAGSQRGRLLLSRRAALAGLATTGLLAGLPGRATEQDVVFDAGRMLPGDYTWHPERSPAGAVAVVVSLPDQLAHVYRNGIRIGVATVSSGKPGHETPTGVFTVLQKDKHHHSATYNNAAMPDTQRLTWDGVALHAGGLPGYPSSHGCVHLPLAFADRLFEITHVGTPVIIAGAASDPWVLVHPGLVLGDTAEGEMSTAVARLGAKSHPADWTSGAAYPVTTVLVTAADRRVVLIEDGAVIRDADLTIDGPAHLGEHVLLLQHPQEGDSQLVWHAVTHHPDPSSPAQPETRILTRLRAPRDFNDALRVRMHPGMTMIISDLAATPDRQSGKDFVIMTGNDLNSPRPVLREDHVPAGTATSRG